MTTTKPVIWATCALCCCSMIKCACWISVIEQQDRERGRERGREWERERKRGREEERESDRVKVASNIGSPKWEVVLLLVKATWKFFIKLNRKRKSEYLSSDKYS